MVEERLEDIRGTLDDIRMYEARETRNPEQADFAKCYLVEMYGEWLIKKAARVQELEDRYNKVLGRSLDFQEQNKRYREALEKVEMVTSYEDEANEIASKALEGDSDV